MDVPIKMCMRVVEVDLFSKIIGGRIWGWMLRQISS